MGRASKFWSVKKGGHSYKFLQGSLAQACFDRLIRLLARYGFEKFCRAKSLAIPHKAMPFVAACVPAVADGGQACCLNAGKEGAPI